MANIVVPTLVRSLAAMQSIKATTHPPFVRVIQPVLIDSSKEKHTRLIDQQLLIKR